MQFGTLYDEMLARFCNLKWDAVHLNPLDPTMKDMIQNVLNNGSQVGVCPPCAKVRGYDEKDLLDGVTLVGSIAIHGPILEGAAALTF